LRHAGFSENDEFIKLNATFLTFFVYKPSHLHEDFHPTQPFTLDLGFAECMAGLQPVAFGLAWLEQPVA